MKPADAKSPKFQAQWWKANKSKIADRDGKLEGALKQYEKLRAEAVSDAREIRKDVAASSDQAVRVLQEIKKLALVKDPKLTALQKETQEALANYAKASDKATAQIKLLQQNVAKLPKVPGLLKDGAFIEYCKKTFVDESIRFLGTVKKAPPADTYKKFLAKGSAPDQLNVPSTLVARFDKVAADIQAAPPADDRELARAWSDAPWPEAVEAVVQMLNSDVVPRYLKYRERTALAEYLPA